MVCSWPAFRLKIELPSEYSRMLPSDKLLTASQAFVLSFHRIRLRQ